VVELVLVQTPFDLEFFHVRCPPPWPPLGTARTIERQA
jgi:hypothetical protein